MSTEGAFRRSVYARLAVVKPDVDLFCWSQKAGGERSSNIHHRLYGRIEGKNASLANGDLSQPHKLRKQKKSAARLEKPTFRAKTLKRTDPLALNHG